MEHFNQAANTWDTPEKLELSEHYAREISKYFPQERLNILEVGCGTGLLGSQFVRNDNRLLGVDTSEGMLEIFNYKFKNNPNVKSHLLNLETEDLAEKNFNLIVSSMAFHHLVHPSELLKKLKGLLNKNGIIAIIDLDEEDGTFHPDPKQMGVHHFGFSKKELESWAPPAGLKLLEWKTVHTIKKNEKDYPLFLAIFTLV